MKSVCTVISVFCVSVITSTSCQVISVSVGIRYLQMFNDVHTQGCKNDKILYCNFYVCNYCAIILGTTSFYEHATCICYVIYLSVDTV